MASNTKAQKIDIEVGEALEKALDIDFTDDLDLDLGELGAIEPEYSLEDLEKQISLASQELANEASQSNQDSIKPASSSADNKAAAADTGYDIIDTAEIIAAPIAPPKPPH